jgi:hypothetical protein
MGPGEFDRNWSDLKGVVSLLIGDGGCCADLRKQRQSRYASLGGGDSSELRSSRRFIIP